MHEDAHKKKTNKSNKGGFFWAVTKGLLRDTKI
jgi:hypothetical protein